MTKKNNLPVIKNILLGELNYTDCDGEEPAIHDDRISITTSVRLNKSYSSLDFQMRFTLIDLNGDEKEQIVEASNADSKKDKKKGRGKFLHFRAENLECKATYKYEILYKRQPLSINHVNTQVSSSHVIIRTPPARRDPQPIKIAMGGDQEQHEQFGPLASLFDLDNHRHTERLYQHIASIGNPDASAIADIQEQPYQLFIHLGDLFNGELFFSWRNIFRANRHVIERKVESRDAFRHHLIHDFGKPVSNHLAHLGYGFCNVSDDHDVGGNNATAPTTKKEIQTRQYMEEAFHEFVLAPNFLTQTSDGYGLPDVGIGREGPYYKKRIGQSEFFFLHNRYTQNPFNPKSFLLGEAQWQWLEESLANSKASNKVLISPLPFVMGKNPDEDYRGHWQEWHRMMQLCRQYKIGTILAADSHNYSHSEIHVREVSDNAPWIVHQHLIGTLGGSKQYICDAEMTELNKPGRPPLLPQNEAFDATLYAGSTVKAYFSPGDNKALLPISINSLFEMESMESDSEWTGKKEWKKGTHGYAGMIFTPLVNASPVENLLSTELDELEELEDVECFIKQPHAMPWHVKSCLFTCSDKKNPIVTHEERLDCEYTVEPFCNSPGTSF